MRVGKSNLVIVLAVALLLIIVVPLAVVLTHRPRVLATPLPSPNAYATLAEAGRHVTGTADFFDPDDLAQLRQFIAMNESSLHLVNTALQQQSLVPIDYEAGMTAAVDDASLPRDALRVLFAEARAAELEGNEGDAALRYAQIAALGYKSSHGGFLVHTLVGIASERMALSRLKELASDLTPRQKGDVLTVMASTNRQPHNFDQIVQREHLMARKEHGTLSGSWMIRMTAHMAEPALRQAKASDQEVVRLNEEVLELLRQ